MRQQFVLSWTLPSDCPHFISSMEPITTTNIMSRFFLQYSFAKKIQNTDSRLRKAVARKMLAKLTHFKVFEVLKLSFLA